MKNILTLTFAFICSSQILFSQQRLDYVWPLGYDIIYQDQNGIVVGGILMDFNYIPPSLSLLNFISDEQKAGICDSSGQLLAYTDGCNIYNRDHAIMLNGDSLNPGKVFELFCSAFQDYPLWQGFLFLPKPGSSDTFYLFHLRDDDELWNPMDLMYSIIGANGDNGKGEVISKNQVVFSDSIWLGNFISATRHGNGRDWWIATPQRYSPGFHLSLLTPEGVTYKGLQFFGDSTTQVYTGQIAFSPDGSKFFRHWPEGLLMLDFDRCTGIFSNPFYIDYSDFPAAGGVAVSSGGRFLYATKGNKIYQYDLQATDIVASRITVAEYDGYVSPFPTYFFQAGLAPDGKIYIGSTSTNNILHVIHDPDSLGLACNVEQHGVTLPALTSYIMPNFANYRLYDFSGSPCDTLGINTPVATKEPKNISSIEITLTPNPASKLLTIRLESREPGQIIMTDITGKTWFGSRNTGYTAFEVNVRHLPEGVYIVSFRSDAGQYVARKLVVQHP